jgi:hypothetical protein
MQAGEGAGDDANGANPLCYAYDALHRRARIDCQMTGGAHDGLSQITIGTA